MSSFLERLAQRTLGTAVLASPRTPGLFSTREEPVLQAMTTRHTAPSASPAGVPGDTDGPVHRGPAPPAPRPQQPAHAPPAPLDGLAVERRHRERASLPDADANPAREAAPPGASLVNRAVAPVTRDRLDTTPMQRTSARRADVATPGPVNAVPQALAGFEPLVARDATASQPTASSPLATDTPAPVAGPGALPPRQAAASAPEVHITIGAVEVRTPAGTPRMERTAVPAPRPGLSLNDYLRRGRGSA